MKMVKLICTGMMITGLYYTANAASFSAPVPETFSLVTNVSAPGNALQSSAQDRKIKSFKREWNRKIDRLNVNIAKDERRIKKSGARDEVKWKEEIRDMKVKRDELKKEIDEAANSASDNWNKFERDINDKYAVLKEDVKDFFKR